MNNVHRELAHKATRWCVENATGTPKAWEWEDKFAECIIRECAIMANRAENNERELRPAMEVVLDHFGLKP